MRTLSKIAILLSIAGLATALAGPAAAATPSGSHRAGQLTAQQRAAEVLRNNPGARRLSATEVELTAGVVLTVAVVDPSCPVGALCMWENIYRGGERLSISRCGRLFTLSQFILRGTNDWRDDISSIWNNQTGGVTSYFYDYKLLTYHQIATLKAGNYLQDLTRNPATSGGGNLNDRIDQVYAC